MEKQKISWTDVEKEALNFILANKKAFLKECAKRCQIHQLITFHSTTGWQQEVYYKYRDKNPNYGDRLMAIGIGIHLMCQRIFDKLPDPFPREYVVFLEKLEIKFWQRILRKYDRLKFKVGNSSTHLLKEALERGFIHEQDNEWDPKKPFVLKIGDLNLEWPKNFLTEEEANEVISTHGIGKCYLHNYHSNRML